MTDAPTWEQALDDLEKHLQHAEVLRSGDAEEMPTDTWVKPAGLGPLPPHLVDRAMELRSRRAALISTLVAAIPAALAEGRGARETLERPQPGGRRRATPMHGDVSA